jgi:hypothetical protein
VVSVAFVVAAEAVLDDVLLVEAAVAALVAEAASEEAEIPVSFEAGEEDAAAPGAPPVTPLEASPADALSVAMFLSSFVLEKYKNN